MMSAFIAISNDGCCIKSIRYQVANSNDTIVCSYTLCMPVYLYMPTCVRMHVWASLRVYVHIDYVHVILCIYGYVLVIVCVCDGFHVCMWGFMFMCVYYVPSVRLPAQWPSVCSSAHQPVRLPVCSHGLCVLCRDAVLSRLL